MQLEGHSSLVPNLWKAGPAHWKFYVEYSSLFVCLNTQVHENISPHFGPPKIPRSPGSVSGTFSELGQMIVVYFSTIVPSVDVEISFQNYLTLALNANVTYVKSVENSRTVS